MTEWFDPLGASFTRDPYPVYAQLRALDEPMYYAPLDCHLLSRFDDVDAAVRNPQMLRSLARLVSDSVLSTLQRRANFHDMPNHERYVQNSMLEQDGASHHRLRTVVLREFSRKLIESHRQMIEQHVEHLVEEALAKGTMDFVADFAERFPGYVIGRVLGVPDADYRQLHAWSEQIVQYFDADRTADRKAAAEAASAAFAQYLQRLIEQRRKHAKDDLISILVRAQGAGELDETELISLSLLILAGGHGSTIDVLGTGMLALLQHPDQQQALRRNPTLMNSAVDEMLRYQSPLPFFHRYAGTELQVMGRTYPKGTKFGLLYGAANRDPAAFPAPDIFLIDRQPNRHLAFGRGAHLCLGNNLARLNMACAFRALLKRTRRIELLDPVPEYRPGLASRGLRRLMVSATPA